MLTVFGWLSLCGASPATSLWFPICINFHVVNEFVGLKKKVSGNICQVSTVKIFNAYIGDINLLSSRVREVVIHISHAAVWTAT